MAPRANPCPVLADIYTTVSYNAKNKTRHSGLLLQAVGIRMALLATERLVIRMAAAALGRRVTAY